MADSKKMKNRVGSTSTKQQILKENFVVGAAWRKYNEDYQIMITKCFFHL